MEPSLRLDREQQVLCLASRSTLDDAARTRLAALAGGRLDWDRLWHLAHLHEVVPLVARSLSAAAADRVPDDWRARAEKRRHVTIVSNSRLAGQLRRVLDRHAEAGIPAVPVKGLVVADLLYGDPAIRPSVDLDVLVRTADLDASRNLLRELGYRQRTTHSFIALTHEFHDPAWFFGEGPEQVRLELHRALWDPNLFGLSIDELWGRTRPGTLLGGPALLLSWEDMLLHLAIHRSRSALRLRWVCDVAEMVRSRGDELDWAALDRLATRAGARTALWVVLDLAHRLLDAPVPGGVLRDLRPSPLRTAILDRTCGLTALFRPAAPDDLEQGPPLVLRSIEQDGVGHVARAMAGNLARRARRIAHNLGIRRVPQPVRPAGEPAAGAGPDGG